jgi:hypothetical protein
MKLRRSLYAQLEIIRGEQCGGCRYGLGMTAQDLSTGEVRRDSL